MFISGLRDLIAIDDISDTRLWHITLTNGNKAICRIVSFDTTDGYVIAEEWYDGKKLDQFDLMCINADHIVMVELHKENA